MNRPLKLDDEKKAAKGWVERKIEEYVQDLYDNFRAIEAVGVRDKNLNSKTQYMKFIVRDFDTSEIYSGSEARGHPFRISKADLEYLLQMGFLTQQEYTRVYSPVQFHVDLFKNTPLAKTEAQYFEGHLFEIACQCKKYDHNPKTIKDVVCEYTVIYIDFKKVVRKFSKNNLQINSVSKNVPN